MSRRLVNALDMTPDIVVGRMVEGTLQVQVSVRGDVIVTGFGNSETSRGVSISFSPKAAEQFIDIVTKAVRVAKGKG